MMGKKTETDGDHYSRTWLARYGQGLKRDEIQLVQAYRGLPRTQQATVLRLLRDLIISGVQRGGPTAHELDLAAGEILNEPYHWKCNEPGVTNKCAQ